MTFAMFITWVLVGVLAGVLAGLVMKRGGYGVRQDIMLGLAGAVGLSAIVRIVGIFPGAGIVAMVPVACIGAVMPILAQRRFKATEDVGDERGLVWRWALGGVLVAAVFWMMLGPTPQQPAATGAAIEDKTYPVTPAAMTVKAGIVTGAFTDMKVTERVEQGSGRIDSAAKLTAKLVLKNSSTNQTVRLVGGKVRYVDAHGQAIELEQGRNEPILKLGSSERLDPGQEATEFVDVEFPAEALKAKRLGRIRVELAYIPSPYREEALNFAVAVGQPK